MRKTLGSFLIAIFASLTAHALPGNQWQSVISRLEASGLSGIGVLKFNELRRIARTIHWHEIQGPPPSVMSGSRQSGYNTHGNAYISQESNPDAAAEGPITELHELLGAARIFDTDYSASLALHELSIMSPGPERTRRVRFYAEKYFQNKFLRMAGGSSVSGGGDWTISSLKRRVLELIVQNGSVQDSFRAIYGRILFEPIADSVIALHFGYRIDPFTKRESVEMIVYYPRDRYVQRDDTLITEIARKLTEIFPARPGGSTVSFQPSSCRGTNHQVSFPATQDSSVRSMQDLIGGYIRKCKGEIERLPGFTGRAVTTPAIGQAPRKVDGQNFDCSISANGQSASFPITTQRGIGTISTIGWIGDVYASTRITADGQISDFRILVKNDQPILVPSPSPYQASVSVQTSAGRVDVSCTYSRN